MWVGVKEKEKGHACTEKTEDFVSQLKVSRVSNLTDLRRSIIHTIMNLDTDYR